MFDYETLPRLQTIIKERARADARLLDELRAEVRLFADGVRKIQRRSATAVSLVASDGGNNKLVFDPFYVQLVRVTDSYGKELCLDVVSPSTDTDVLSEAQFNHDGSPKTALGRMMAGLGITLLSDLSPMIPAGADVREHPEAVKPGWVLVYRDLCEWAVLYERICCSSFATDTLVVRDGLLRSKIFNHNLFMKWRQDVLEAIEKIYREDRRKVFLVGLAKHSNVITRYRLAISLEGVFPPGEPRYVRIPRALESKAYIWPEYARGAESEEEGGEAPKFVAGDLYLVRFGTRSGDPIWAVDILSGQSDHAQEIFGYLLNDAVEGFPIPFYPLCLQKAHQHAQVVDFDLDIFQDGIYRAIQEILPPEKKDIIDLLRFNSDVSLRRYG
jgi:hypothetical protein